MSAQCRELNLHYKSVGVYLSTSEWMNYFTMAGGLLKSWVPVQNAVERVWLSIKGVSDNQKIFFPEAEELPVHCTGETEKVCGDDRTLTWEQIGCKTGSALIICLCVHAPGILYSIHMPLPVGDNILETDKQLAIHVQFIDSGVDGILTWSVNMEFVSIGDN